MKTRFGATEYEIAEGAGVLVDVVRSSACGPRGAAPAVLLVAPPPLATLTGRAERDPDAFEGFETMCRDALETSRDFARQFDRVASVRRVGFLDAARSVETSAIDGVHWPLAGHDAFGRAVAVAVRDAG